MIVQIIAIPVTVIVILDLIGGLVFALMDKQLQGFVTLRFKTLPPEIKRGTRMRVGDLVGAKLDAPSAEPSLRIIACNMERGRVLVFDKHGRLRRTPFREMVGGVVLYHKKLTGAKSGADLDGLLNEVITFDPVFERLYPANMVTFGRGLSVHWEVQILDGGAVHRRLVGPPAIFTWTEFFDKPGTKPVAPPPPPTATAAALTKAAAAAFQSDAPAPTPAPTPAKTRA